MFITNLNAVGKFVMAILTAVGVTAITAILTGVASVPTVVSAVILAVTALCVYHFKNDYYGWQTNLKAIISVVGAVGVPTISAVFTGELTPAMIVAGIMALFGSAAVYQVTNTTVTPIAESDYIDPALLED